MDLGSKYTDAQIQKLERRIRSVYREAQRDIDSKIKDFNSRFETKNKIKLEKVKKGEITDDEYKRWLSGQVFQGERWKAKRQEIAGVLYEANSKAVQITNGQKANVFAFNSNYQAYQLEHSAGVNFGFDLYDSATVVNLIKNEPNLLPKMSEKVKKSIDIPWNTKKITRQITQGIIQGEKLDDVAKRLSKVTDQDWKFMRTHARTAMTGAQNAGRQQRLNEAQNMGIRVHKEWMATLDGRTRYTHRGLDGQKRLMSEPFEIDGYTIMFPGDPEAHPSMTYNCRCTMVGDLDDYPSEYKRYDNIDGSRVDSMTYEEWYEAKGKTHMVASKVLQAARNAEKAVTRDLSHAVELGSGHLEGLGFRFKGRGSLERKIVDKSAKKNIPHDQYARQITDALRYTNVSSPENLTDDYLKIVGSLESKGYSMVEVANTLWDETAEYRGINTLVSTPKGYTFELQFHTPQSIEIKEVNHKLYEEQRLATTPEDRKVQLGIEMASNAKSIVTPANIDVIGNKFLDSPIRQW